MILFHKGTTGFDLKDKLLHKKWLKTIAAQYQYSIGDLNYVFQTDEELLQLNQDHLNHDTFTDIITFDNRDGDGPIEGDIFISIDRVQENANTFKTTYDIELKRVMAHGLLHLVGLGDKSETEKTEMREAEEKALELFEKL